MSVRRAEIGDLPQLIAIFQQFYIADGRPVSKVGPLADYCIEHILAPNRICLVSGDPIAAFLAGAVLPHFHTGIPTAAKTVWLSLPGKGGHGAALIRPFEEWARKQGARRIFFSGRDERTQRLLKLKGYTQLEVAFDKDL